MTQNENQKTANSSTILGVDIGTTSMKMGVFQIVDNTLSLVRQFTQEYEVNIYNDGLFGDIEQDKCCLLYTSPSPRDRS